MDTVIVTLIVGIGATATMDLWGIVRKPLLGIASPDYGLVGRWMGHMMYGRFHHESIASSSPIRGERIIGWSAHYLIGVMFAALLIGICGVEWVQQPALGPAIGVGIGTVVAPFLLMQPGMGAGVAAANTPNPASARIQSLITHAVFGLGLYLAGWVVHFICST